MFDGCFSPPPSSFVTTTTYRKADQEIRDENRIPFGLSGNKHTPPVPPYAALPVGGIDQGQCGEIGVAYV
jgi:hypothetical protein